jgi:hypothetical protein
MTANYLYEKAHKQKLEKLGFKFEKRSILSSKLFVIGDPVQIEIFSLEELMFIVQEFGQIVLDEGEIEIYDGYRE